ncbi:DNA repair protein RecN [BD1-7 clade bacterium]|uniref:DNA repair protein RecN n=1 Tax=BD1-7 clade bacterium TaxID=2029982 RepID=A0A5S9PG33_9GAMM|nr:DNA repair protein RecN [BD1-7 clade bacterium]CAA0110216.1 DNA repair protein RecN [BD1-7 clade bacterium]
MLVSLSVSHFTIADQLNIDFRSGMTAITGETGAGKSIALDALGLALGARSDSNVVRHGSDKADIRAVFDLSKLPAVRQWLATQDLDCDDECITRRVITKEGRSRAYINGQPVNLQSLKALGAQLVDIHSQHAHHQLLDREYHQHLLDAFANNGSKVDAVNKHYKAWRQTQSRIEQIHSQNHENDTRREYLQFQLQEFKELALQDGEYQQLESRHQLIANAEKLQQTCQQSLMVCRDADDSAVIDQLQRSLHDLEPLADQSPTIKEAHQLISSAMIQVEEACYSLRDQLDNINSDQSELAQLESRLSAIHDLARKHRCEPETLLDTQTRLTNELDQLVNADAHLEQLASEAQTHLTSYHLAAAKLADQRSKSAKKLGKQIKAQLTLLGMGNCVFEVALNSNTEHVSLNGYEQVEFKVATNPGQPAQGLHKIASGGELSRISLAIQVITAQTSTIPTLVFDEVDVGIGGATAEVVGRLLRQLAGDAQIVCVTHQPQVASQAHQHYYVAKQQTAANTTTQMISLDKDDKVKEIARMLGGIEITQRTLEHAEEMLLH